MSIYMNLGALVEQVFLKVVPAAILVLALWQKIILLES